MVQWYNSRRPKEATCCQKLVRKLWRHAGTVAAWLRSTRQEEGGRAGPALADNNAPIIIIIIIIIAILPTYRLRTLHWRLLPRQPLSLSLSLSLFLYNLFLFSSPVLSFSVTTRVSLLSPLSRHSKYFPAIYYISSPFLYVLLWPGSFWKEIIFPDISNLTRLPAWPPRP